MTKPKRTTVKPTSSVAIGARTVVSDADVASAYKELLSLIQQHGTSDGLHIAAESLARSRADAARRIEVTLVVPLMAAPGDALTFGLEDNEPRIRLLHREAPEEKKITWTVTGKEIRRYREQRKLNRPQFAAIMGYSPDQIYRWEKGKRPVPETVARFLVLFKLLPDVLQARYVERATEHLTFGRRSKR